MSKCKRLKMKKVESTLEKILATLEDKNVKVESIEYDSDFKVNDYYTVLVKLQTERFTTLEIKNICKSFRELGFLIYNTRVMLELNDEIKSRTEVLTVRLVFHEK